MTESSRASHASFERAVALSRTALDVDRAGLLSDFDGTLSAMAADPASAVPADGVVDVLGALARRLAVVALVTGRAAMDARRLIGVREVLVVGNHGLEWLEPGADAARPTAGVPAALPSGLLDRVPRLDGVIVEDKGLSATIHYRLAADTATARAAIIGALRGAVDDAFAVSEGRMSVEIRPRGAGDKGTAATAIVHRYGLGGVLVMGDDVTDLDMFRAVDALRDAGHLRAAIVAVGGADREVPAAVASAADAVVPEPADVVRLLRALS